MLFREFNIIAAAAFAAQRAHDGSEQNLWDELSESEQNIFMQAVMAVARGETIDAGPVFVATAKAILEFNGGQGGLALEELANIGGEVLSLGLLSEEEVADRNIRETVVELLHELADRRQGNALGAAAPAYSEDDLRTTALATAVDQTKKAKEAGKEYPFSVVEAAATFYDFLAKGDGRSWMRCTALHAASSVTNPGLRPASLALVAEDFMLFLEPPQPEPDQAVEEPQVETVQ